MPNAAVVRKHTAAYRSEGHGMVERFNQAISEKLKTIISQEDLEWHRGLPWVKLAYNSAPHAALTMGGEGLSPAEVHIGRKLRMEVHEEEIEEEEKLKKAPSLYVQQLKKHLENVHAWTKKSQEEYNTKMRAIANKRKKRRHRQWQPGDTVRLEVPDNAKLQDKYDGPYEVLSRDTDYEYTIRKIGSIKIKTQVHANRLADFNDIMEDAANKKEEQQGKIVWAENVQVMEDDEEEEQDTVKAIKKEKQEAAKAIKREKRYEVEKILDDQGSRKEKNKKYKIKWLGYPASHNSWEPLENLTHCPKMVEKYELSKAGVSTVNVTGAAGRGRELIVARVEEIKGEGIIINGNEGRQCKRAIMEVAAPRRITLKMDINDGKTAQQTLKEICDRAGIKQEDIVVAWASPPCNTYSRANASNISRGNHYREADGTPVQGEKGKTATQHDRLTKKVKEMLKIIKKFVMENPAGGLEKMKFMMDWEDKKKLIDLCAYAWPFKKATNLWTENIDWEPKGNTGTGRCEHKCGQGEVNRVTGLFKHYMALAVHPERGPRGEGAVSLKCGMPTQMLQEIMMQVAREGEVTDKVVLDLCAGFQSLRDTALKLGMRYVAVDIQGERNKPKEGEQQRKYALVMMENGQVLAQKKHQWTIPKAEKGATDTSVHDTAVKAMQTATGLNQQSWISNIREGPAVVALRDTTYFIYKMVNLKTIVGNAKEGMKIVEARGAQWNEEDEEAIKKYTEKEDKGAESNKYA